MTKMSWRKAKSTIFLAICEVEWPYKRMLCSISFFFFHYEEASAHCLYSLEQCIQLFWTKRQYWLDFKWWLYLGIAQMLDIAYCLFFLIFKRWLYIMIWLPCKPLSNSNFAYVALTGDHVLLIKSYEMCIVQAAKYYFVYKILAKQI